MLGRRGDEVRVDTEEGGEVGERLGQIGQAGRRRWFEVCVVEVAVVEAQQPGEVEQAQIAVGDKGAAACDRGKPAFGTVGVTGLLVEEIVEVIGAVVRGRTPG
ncbi:hypothetical protein ABT213_33470 [Streptomyces sp. NPDC001674]|uniref:hypothetical protein n=1 Tax=Streptomyces sp. NPDC001674 TaxID=3154394 RepID=UPI003330C772